MHEHQMTSFEEFWPYYLGEHCDPTNRALHALGTAAAMGTVAAAVTSRKWKLLALAPLLGYGPAWIGHFVIEKNKPASFKHPLWSLRGDARMLKLMATRELDDELARLGLENETAPPLR